jgi:tetratricopeptide (TPR) repeat protein
MKQWYLIISLLAISLSTLTAQTNFSRGETFFMTGRPQEALGFLETAIVEDPTNVKAFLYLGMIYQQLDRIEDAIALYLKVLPRAGVETARVAYNLGNVYYSLENITQAEMYYTRAIEADPSFASAYLNRGNSRLYMERLDDAFADYDHYLALEPRSPKRSQIEQIKALAMEERAAETERQKVAAEKQRAAEEERQRLVEELARAEAAVEEERRVAAEELARAVAAWKQLFFNEIVASLQAQARKTLTVPVGAETVQWEANDFELD